MCDVFGFAVDFVCYHFFAGEDLFPVFEFVVDGLCYEFFCFAEFCFGDFPVCCVPCVPGFFCGVVDEVVFAFFDESFGVCAVV